MDLKKILKSYGSGYGSIFSVIVTFAAIAGICALVSIAIVYPLWVLATTNPGLYTVITLAGFGLCISFFLIRKLIFSYKKNPQKLFISLLKKITVIGGLVLIFFLIGNYYKITALIVLLLIIIIYGFLAFYIQQEKN